MFEVHYNKAVLVAIQNCKCKSGAKVAFFFLMCSFMCKNKRHNSMDIPFFHFPRWEKTLLQLAKDHLLGTKNAQFMSTSWRNYLKENLKQVLSNLVK